MMNERDDSETVGIAIAHWADWDGIKIVEAFLTALTDANFHTLAAKVHALAVEDGAL